MFGYRFRAAICGHLTSALITAIAIAVLTGLAPAKAAAQGPPEGVVPGVGRVVLEGELDVLYEDDDDRGRLLHFLISDNDKRRIPLRFQEGEAPDLPTGSRVQVVGDLAEGEVTTESVTTLATSTSRTMGAQDVLVILFNFSNNPTQSVSASTLANVNDQVRNYYLENTYGQTILSFSVTGWYTIAASDTKCDYYTWSSQAESAATKAGINLSAYDRYIFAFPKASSCGWLGMGNVGGPRSWVNGSYTVKTVAHEQGHNFGDHHSRATKCDSAGCATVEYGDDRDVLGRSGVVGHLNAFQKERLGWLNYGNSPAIQTVTGSGDYWIDNYETIAGATKALKIWNPAKSAYYYIESRAQVGFDSNVAAGVTVHLALSGVSYQQDFDFTSTYDSTLNVGQVVTDPAMGLSLQTLSSSVDGALIRVTLGSVACTNQAPGVSMSSSGAMKYTVTLKNNNSSSCAPSVFSVAATVPAGWSGSFSPASSASLSPGASASTTLTLVAPTGSTGTYSFGVTGTDTASGLTKTVTGSVVVATSLDVTASASVTTGNGNNRSVAIKVGAKAGTQAAAGAAITVVITGPQGDKTTLSATAGVDGIATLKLSPKPKDPSGVYQVLATASKSGATGQATTSFILP